MGAREILLFGAESPSPIFASSRDPDEQLMTFLTNWFVSHTREEDAKIGAYLKSRNQTAGGAKGDGQQ